MPEGSFFSFAASLQYRADSLPSSCHERPASSSAPSRSRAIRRRLTADGSRWLRSVRENCHHRPSMRARRPSFSIAFRSFWLMARTCAAAVAVPVADAREAEEIGRQLRALGVEDEGPAHPENAAEETGLEDDVVPRRSLTGAGEGDAVGLTVVQSSWANTNAAKSTSRVSSTRRSSVVVPGLKDVVQGSTCATSSRPRVSAWSSLACLPDEPRKMRGLSIRSSTPGQVSPLGIVSGSRPRPDETHARNGWGSRSPPTNRPR